MEEDLIKVHEKRQERATTNSGSDICESIKIDGYNIEYANFRNKCLVVTKEEKTIMDARKFALFEFSKATDHSVQAALEAVRWLINPFDVQLFFRCIKWIKS